MRLKGIKLLAQGHPTCKWQSEFKPKFPNSRDYPVNHCAVWLPLDLSAVANPTLHNWILG